MRFIVKPLNDRTAKLASNDTYRKLLKIAKDKRKDLISDTIYRDAYDTPDGKQSRVEDQLALSYFYKCAYCERITKADIEHYRPKKEVKNIKHDGYYWLCYEWSNLIPSCVTCNREGAKHNYFDIFGTRVTEPTFINGGSDLDLFQNNAANSPLIDEIPGLLHPEIDDPTQYFHFDVDKKNLKDGIRLKPASTGDQNEQRSLSTIKICKLNRQELRIDRVRVVVKPFVVAVDELINLNMGNHNGIIDELNKQILALFAHATDDELSHTLLRKYIIESENNFKSIVLPFFKPNRQALILSAFQSKYHS